MTPATILWEPKSQPHNAISGPISDILATRFALVDGRHIDLNATCTLYLEALADARIGGADTLLEAIAQHGSIRIWLG